MLNTHSAIASGNHPPCRTLVRLAAKNVRSTIQNATAPVTVIHNGRCHSARTTKKNSSVSIASVPVTAIPYADASRSEEPKPSTSATTAAKMIQFAAGT